MGILVFFFLDGRLALSHMKTAQREGNSERDDRTKRGVLLSAHFSGSSQMSYCCMVIKWTTTSSPLNSMLPHLSEMFFSASLWGQLPFILQDSSAPLREAFLFLGLSWPLPLLCHAQYLTSLYCCNLLWRTCICWHALLSKWGTLGDWHF